MIFSVNLKRRKPSLITLADRARNGAQWELAAQLYRKALERNPDNPPIWVQYGHALKEQGLLAEAESAYRKAVDFEPPDADAYLQLGHVLKLQGKTGDAEVAYLHSLVCDPSLHHAALELAQLGWSDAHFTGLNGMVGPDLARRAERISPANAGNAAVLAGSFDSLVGAVATGWAWNPAAPDQPVEVKFYVGDKIVGSCRTSTFRGDVKAAGYAVGPCGYETTLNIGSAADAAVEVRACVVETGRELSNSPRISVPRRGMPGAPRAGRPVGHFRGPNGAPAPALAGLGDRATMVGSILDPMATAGSFDALMGMIASGWAWNPAAPDQPVTVEFYIDDEIVGSCRTHVLRKDVGAAGYASGPCGFETKLSVDLPIDAPVEVRARVAETGEELANSPRISTLPEPMKRLMRKERVAGTILARLRERLDRETDGRLSIIMPVYNTKEEWLREAIESVRAQWCSRWELLCIDDGSPAPHVDRVLQEYAEQDTRISHIRLENNGGIATATNRGIFAAKGAYIAFMDHDDYLEPDAVYWLLRATKTGAKLIYSDEVVVGEHLDFVWHLWARPSFSYDFYLSNPYFVHMVCVERSLAQDIGGWDATMKISGDVDFVLRILQHTREVTHVPRILYRWRMHDGSAGHIMQPHVTAATLGSLNRHLSHVFPSAYATEGMVHNQFKIVYPDDMGKTTIVILNDGRIEHLKGCIESIRRTTNRHEVHIIIVDNSSASWSVSQGLEPISTDIQIISQSGTFKCAAMLNDAVSRVSTRTRYLLFLDCGIEAIEDGWLERMRSIANRADVGAVGATLLNRSGTIQQAGVIVGFDGAAESAHKSAAYANETGRVRNPGYMSSLVCLRDYSAVTAACMMMRWDIFNRVGGFDERLLVRYYDTDICLQVREAGLKVLNDPYSVFYHDEDARKAPPDPNSEDSLLFCDRWQDLIANGDPFYNPLLVLAGKDHTADSRPIIGKGARVNLVAPPGRAPAPGEPGKRQRSLRPAAKAADEDDMPRSRRHYSTFRVVYISGEPETPGHWYRVVRPMAAAATLGASVTWMRVDEIPVRLAELEAADAVTVWRVPWGEDIALAVHTARRSNAKIIFDVDDLMIDPELARLDVIDGIRTQYLTTREVEELYDRLRMTMTEADFCSATTQVLAEYMRHARKSTIVLPNAFNSEILAASRLAVRYRARQPEDRVVRIGYAGGSRTHQRDFAQCVDAVADVLRQNAECRLVAFRSSDGSVNVMDFHEFPALRGLEDRIEWRNMVPLERLPGEIARFDINLAPLEVGNPFCEAKSELKYFEAALSGVPTIASPTGPYRRAIRDGETGFLASTASEWRDALQKLVGDPLLRRRISDAALRDVLWKFGPEQQLETMSLLFDLVRGGREAARAFELSVLRQRTASQTLPQVPDHELVFDIDHLRTAKVTVVVPLYNYADYVREALDSVAAQTLRDLDLIIVDDCSTDDSLNVAVDWVKASAARFNRALVLRNSANSGLGLTRNVGFDEAETQFVLTLDADNRLLGNCAAACLETAEKTGAAFAYPIIKQFGSAEDLMGTLRFDPMRLSLGNYIDAMALIAKSVWLAVGGYDHARTGWEDFELWCKFAERGFRGVQVPGGALAEYRIHADSMTQTMNNLPGPARAIMKRLEELHPWLTLVWPLPYSSRESDEDGAPAGGAAQYRHGTSASSTLPQAQATR